MRYDEINEHLFHVSSFSLFLSPPPSHLISSPAAELDSSSGDAPGETDGTDLASGAAVPDVAAAAAAPAKAAGPGGTGGTGGTAAAAVVVGGDARDEQEDEEEEEDVVALHAASSLCACLCVARDSCYTQNCGNFLGTHKTVYYGMFRSNGYSCSCCCSYKN